MRKPMKAVQLLEPAKVELTEVPVPEIGPSEVLLKVRAAGVCQTDVHFRHLEEEAVPRGTVLGHEIAGEVASAGAAVTGWEPGDAAVVYPCWGCGTCRMCLAGRHNMCRRTGGRFISPPTPGVSRDGGMAEYVAVPAWALVPIGDLDPALAAPLADAALVPYHSVHAVKDLLVPGSTAVIIGAGGLGQMAAQILRALTSAQVIALDVNDDALTAVRDEVDATLRSDSSTVVTDVLALTGGYGAEVVFDFVGRDSTMALAAGLVAPGGAIRFIGLSNGVYRFTAGSGVTDLPWEVSVTRPYSGTIGELADIVALAHAGKIRPQVRRFPFDQALKALEELEAGRIRGRAVLTVAPSPTGTEV
ncbi:alcohol dehydrogenase catalytic domain-containing protein [Streptomyces sp. NPDC091271]|uniref:alcohol dehydrogenase catalytic domain-containing protein n=1 Tax=Streptomyces sp. NPDC091271 TaxID=3365980 RepID=UPI00381EE3DA